MYERILVALDGSARAEGALARAAALASGLGSELLLLSVLERASDDAADSPTRRYLEEQRAQLERDGIAARVRTVVDGHAGDAIVRVADEEQVALICLGTHGLGGLRRLVLGSVADHVVQRAAAPVLLVRPGAEEDEGDGMDDAGADGEARTGGAGLPAEVARLLVEQAPDAVIFADRSGQIRGWNAGAERIFGHPTATALGQGLDLIVPEQFREAHWAGYEKAVAQGHTESAGAPLPTRAMRPDGEPFYVELSFAIVRDAQGEVLGALALARDIDERFQRDRTERRRVRELEAELEQLRAGSGDSA